jgi:hypothetical protein
MKLPKQSPIILGAAILIVIAVILLINLKPVKVYGAINNKGSAYIMRTEVINCQAVNSELGIINPSAARPHNGEETTINGYQLFNTLIITAFNSTYDPKIECFSVHVGDVSLETQDQTVNAGNYSLIELRVINKADNRLFHQEKIITDCVVVQDELSGYINPGQTQTVFFNISCSQGLHESTIEFLFVDELTNQHSERNEIIITAV